MWRNAFFSASHLSCGTSSCLQFVFRIPLSLPVFAVLQCETWERLCVCFSNQVLTSRQVKACGVKRLTAATNRLRSMHTFSFRKESGLLCSTQSMVNLSSVTVTLVPVSKAFIYLVFPQKCYSLLLVQRENRKLFGCVRLQVRSHGTKERKHRWSWNWATFPRLQRQTFTSGGYKVLMKVMCLKRSEFLRWGDFCVSVAKYQKYVSPLSSGDSVL